MHSLTRLLLALWAVLCLLIQPASVGWARPGFQASTPEEKARELLEQLTPQERVGQLFMVTFEGATAGTEDPIYDLITRYHVGGVVLLAENDNFPSSENLPESVLSLNRQLQLSSWNNSQQAIQGPGGESYTPQFIPLLIGIPQEGDGYPYSQIFNGVTPLPNEMALGATWDPGLARQVGEVLGRELSAMGFNLLLGPSLDVLETPHAEGSTDLGVRTFGGDPYWVGEMGKAYVSGVHAGSQNHIAVVASHFPGHGAADRLPEQEVATVRKSLSQLADFDLVPFFAVTGEAPSPEATLDGLLTSHIHYQGFQGNIRDTTRPVTLDPQAFNELLQLEPIKLWRSQSGLMISDNLGSQAVRRYNALNNRDFDARQVALNAFYAGNDLLYIADFTSNSEPDNYAAAVRTLDFFKQKYQEDPVFAQRVNESVQRILTLKFRLYSTFTFNEVITPPAGLEQVGAGEQVTLEVARKAATLISPSLAELGDAFPDPPNQNDRMVFITDAHSAKQCSACAVQPVLDVRALETVVVRRYGPDAGGVINPNNLISYSLDELNELLTLGPGDSPLESDLKRAHWVIFSMVGSMDGDPSYAVLKSFLSERPDLFQQKRVIVFAFGAPYYLDATNISKLAAYYGLYSKARPFVDVAAYLLFRELAPEGSLPVSIPGVYDLNQALFADPDQVIQLFLDEPGPSPDEATVTPTLPAFGLGDIIPVRTGVIVDRNGNAVPDGTPVEFIMTMGGEASAPRQVETTRDGVARTTFQVTNSGVIEIRAESEPAKQSNILRFDIQTGTAEVILAPTGTPEPTETPTPTPTVTPTQPVAATPIPPEPPEELGFSDWLIALMVTGGFSLVSYRLASLMGHIRWGVRGAFLALIGGLLSYSYLALKLPGAERMMEGSVARGVILITLGGAAIGLAATWLWRSLATIRHETPA